MRPYVLYVDDDWTAKTLEVGTILRFLGKDHDVPTKRSIYGFEVIGNPVEDGSIPKIVFT